MMNLSKIDNYIPFIIILFISIIYVVSSFFACNKEDEGSTRVEVKSINTGTNSSSELHYFTSGSMPQYPGGEEELRKFNARNIEYPLEAIADRIEGRVYVQFIIRKTGCVTDAKIVSDANEWLDWEALRVIDCMPDWAPSMVEGKPVNSSVTIPVNFVLNK